MEFYENINADYYKGLTCVPLMGLKHTCLVFVFTLMFPTCHPQCDRCHLCVNEDTHRWLQMGAGPKKD